MVDDFKEYDFDPHNLPRRLLEAIGLMTTTAAQTESIIEMAIGGCLGVDSEYSRAVTTHMAMPLRFSALRATAEIHFDDLDALDRLDELIEKVEEAFNKRTAVVHHSWCRDPMTDAVFTVKESARSRLETNLTPMSIDDVERDAFFVYEAGMMLMAFLGDHNLFPPFPPNDRVRGHKSKAARKKRREAALHSAKS
jgi:hypothetical protein